MAPQFQLEHRVLLESIGPSADVLIVPPEAVRLHARRPNRDVSDARSARSLHSTRVPINLVNIAHSPVRVKNLPRLPAASLCGRSPAPAGEPARHSRERQGYKTFSSPVHVLSLLAARSSCPLPAPGPSRHPANGRQGRGIVPGNWLCFFGIAPRGSAQAIFCLKNRGLPGSGENWVCFVRFVSRQVVGSSCAAGRPARTGADRNWVCFA